MPTTLQQPPFILMVDDVSENLQVLGNFLRAEGYHVTPAINGTQALKIIEKRKPDLMLLDIMMPDMNGFEVCATLKASQETREIPIIFLTAKTETDDVVRGFELGAVDYVTKPFKKEELLARVKTHLSLQQARRDLQELNATKDKFFSIIAHDLRSPFNSFLVLTELMIDDIMGFSQEKIVEMLQKQLKSAKNLFALLENLLAWARLQRGVMEFTPSVLSVETLVCDIISTFQANAEQKNITLRSLVSPEIQVYGDRNMLNTVIRNLISNALKFTETGGRIEISAASQDSMVEVSVTDTGVGMTQQALDALFRIDVKYSQIGTAGERGTGLGLILCKEFVEQQGGSMRVDSVLGQGTTFRFTLPEGKSKSH